ncbi:MAG: glycoside hydrolase family 15 protein [Deltaproteobacteria bacterium]|nr:glycoside hydrolase family 15 protein [Deltaproteobacteria bacterium]
MDLYSAARRLARPFVFSEPARPELPIAARGLIGNGTTAALVRPDGVIDWLCLPRFDSHSVFAGILDPERGGSSAVTPTARPFESLQSYDPDTNVLETLFLVKGQGAARLTDYMPWSDDPRARVCEVHRRIECVEGELELEVSFDPRFDYGDDPGRLEIGAHGVRAKGRAGERLVIVLDEPSEWRGEAGVGVRTKLRLRAGQRRWVILSPDAEEPDHPEAHRPFEHLRLTRRRWREWSSRLQYDGPWRHHVLRSALCLKLLIYAPTGAMVAAPTTSLPEHLGGERNWDYRFAWVRDAALAVRAGNLLGFSAEARDFFHFVRDSLASAPNLRVMYAIDGTEAPDERTIAGLRGHAGSGPVRVGNGARSQLQLDAAGALVDTAHLHERFGGRLTLPAWRSLRGVVDQVSTSWNEPDDGIWEPRSGRRHNVHSKVMCWLALERGAGIAAAFGDDDRAEQWARLAAVAHEGITKNGLDPTGRHFVAAYGEDRVDAATLQLPIHGFLPEQHPLLLSTVARVRQELGHGQFVYRYRAPDGLEGSEGAFILCGFWLSEALALQGDVDGAQEVFIAHAEASNHLGLLAEQIDPVTLAQLGNFPQAFSHLGLINAALRIDLALRLRDEGDVRGPRLIPVERRRRPTMS